MKTETTGTKHVDVETVVDSFIDSRVSREEKDTVYIQLMTDRVPVLRKAGLNERQIVHMVFVELQHEADRRGERRAFEEGYFAVYAMQCERLAERALQAVSEKSMRPIPSDVSVVKRPSPRGKDKRENREREGANDKN